MPPEFDIGKNGEKLVKYLINKCGFICELNNDYALRYDYDLSVNIDGLKFTIEVKTDAYSLKSGNLAIEVHNCKKDCPSGIYSTLADIWVQLLPNEDGSVSAYAINTKKLLLFIESVDPLKKTTKSGNANANLRIYKKETILPEFTRFDNLDKGQLKAVFSEMML